MTIVSATELDASFYASFENADEFAGLVPWAVMVQTDLDEEQRSTLSEPATTPVFGILADGSFAQQLGLEIGSTGTIEDACPEATADDTSCDVGLVPEGATLAQLAWDDGEQPPFAAAPITWALP